MTTSSPSAVARRALAHEILAGLTMRERAATMRAHVGDFALGGDGAWIAGCLCGWGMHANGGRRGAVELHAEHVGSILETTAAQKRADARVQRALEEGDELTRERYAIAEEDAAVTSIAVATEWYKRAMGVGKAHRRADTTHALCGVYLGELPVPARQYHTRCTLCERA